MKASKRGWRLILLLITLLAFGLRVYQLDHFSFWLDEGLTPLRSGYSVPEILSNRIIIQDGVTKDTHPPLYYLLIHFSRALLGESDFSYRYPSVVAGVLLAPLLFQLARRMADVRMALLVAFLTAVNPLQIWYAQEARMYTLFVLLAASATYVLWRALTGRQFLRWFILYITLAGLAFYTHYTAIFLIGGQALFWVWLLWRKGQRRLLMGGALVVFLIVLPLLPYTVPRVFTGAEASYFYVPPRTMLLDVVRGFGLGRTVDFDLLGIKLLGAGVALLLLAGLIGSRRPEEGGWQRRLFLLVYLLAAAIGLMLGSLIKPMYMGVRHIMVGSPAFMLLVAAGLFALPRRPRYLAPIAGLLVLVAGPAISLYHLYYNPHYAKDNLRALIQYVEQQAGGCDLLLYNNAMHLPVHWQYQQREDLMATALPTYPHPAGADTVQQLSALAEKFDRIWFIGNLPADGRDDEALVRRWIQEHLVPVDTFSTHGLNMESKVTAYTTTPVLVDHLPAGGLGLDFQWDGLPPLRAWRSNFDQPAALPTLWLDLFWQGGKPPLPNHQVRFALRGPDGETWVDDSRPFWPVKPRPWPADGLVRLSYHLPVPAGAPAGEYELLLLIWDQASQQIVGNWQRLAAVKLAAVSSWPLVPNWPFSTVASLHFSNDLDLLGLTYAAGEVRPGHPLPISIYWRAGAPPAGVEYRVEIVGPNGKVVRTQTNSPGASWLTADTWPLGTVVLEKSGLYFPPEIAPGRYQLRWSLFYDQTTIPGRPAWRPWNSKSVTLGQVTVEPWPLETGLPAVVSLLQAELGPTIELYGYQLDDDQLCPGETFDLTLYWRARTAPDRSYYTFVHLVSADDGTIVSQLDRIPVDWLRPSNGWRPGEVLTDCYPLPIPADLAPGVYHLLVGMYDPDNGQRLPIIYQGKAQPDDQLLLLTLSYE